MMEMIRSWRIAPVAAWPHAMVDMMRAGIRAITSRKMVSFAKWSVAVILIGMLTGAMAVILPPMASIGAVAVTGLVLLWAMPELRIVPDKLLRKMFFVMVAVQLCAPNYYAIETGYLPWISLRKLASLAVILLFAITVAGSKSARAKIVETLQTNRMLSFCLLGFLVMTFISVSTSASPSNSMKLFTDVFLNMYIPLFTCILVVRSESDILFLLKIFLFAVIIDSAAGAVEFVLQRRYYFDLMPRSLLESMLRNNPTLNAMYYGSSFRNGLYRTNSIFSVSLSFAEFAAIIAPFCFYFVFHGRRMRDQVLGIVAGAFILLALFCSGARGGYIAFLVAMTAMCFLWVLRHSKAHPSSLVGTIAAVFFAIGIAALMAAILLVGRLRNIVLGASGEGTASTDARFEQWNLALPHIFSNPVTGHGLGNSGKLVGYHIESGLPSVDSYIITLLVELGVPGFLFFSGIVVIGVWVGIRLYLRHASSISAMAGPIACSLVAFGIYRIVLSQTENHTLIFIIVGLMFSVSKLSASTRETKIKTNAPIFR